MMYNGANLDKWEAKFVSKEQRMDFMVVMLKQIIPGLQKIHEVNIKQETVQIDLKISGDKTDSKITDDPEANIKNLSVIVTPLEPQNSVRFDPRVLHNQKIE